MARSTFLVVAVVALASTAATSTAQYAHLVMHSDPGEYIGQGQDWDLVFTPITANLSVGAGDPISGGPSYYSFFLDNKDLSHFADLQFSSDQLGLPLTVGSYLNAERAPFASPGHPGLDVAFDGRGSNTLTGSFNILDIEYSFNQATNSYTVLKFDANFIQHSEGLTPALTGTFSYNAVPEPATMAALALGAAGLVARRRKKSKN